MVLLGEKPEVLLSQAVLISLVLVSIHETRDQSDQKEKNTLKSDKVLGRHSLSSQATIIVNPNDIYFTFSNLPTGHTFRDENCIHCHIDIQHLRNDAETLKGILSNCLKKMPIHNVKSRRLEFSIQYMTEKGISGKPT